MKTTHEWTPAVLLQSPLFAPLHPVLARLEPGQFPTFHDFNALLEVCQPPLSVRLGHSLRFVPQESGRLGFEAQYEPRLLFDRRGADAPG